MVADPAFIACTVPVVSTCAIDVLSTLQLSGVDTAAPFLSRSVAVKRVVSFTKTLAAAGEMVSTYPESVIILGHAPRMMAAPMTTALTV